MRVHTAESDAVELVIGGTGQAPVIVTCEHASNRMPPGWEWPDEDRWIRDQHWGSDLGIAPVARGLAGALGAKAVLSRFTRLLVDPNRKEDSDTLFLTEAEGRPVRLNAGLDHRERMQRLVRLYRPYHEAIDRVVDATPGVLLVSLHSFTPVWKGQRRGMEVGVLFDRDEALAHHVAPVFTEHGFEMALNQPYTGKGGLMYSVQHHANTSGRAAIEIELRQDRATDPAYQQRFVVALTEMVRRAVAAL